MKRVPIGLEDYALVQESFYDKMEEDRKRKNKLSMSAYVLAAVEEYMKRDTN